MKQIKKKKIKMPLKIQFSNNVIKILKRSHFNEY